MYLIDIPSLPRINVSISTLYYYTTFSKHWPHAEEISISICRLPVLTVQKKLLQQWEVNKGGLKQFSSGSDPVG